MLQWLKRALTQNLLLKFAALVCAIVVWVYVDGFVETTKQFSVPVLVPAEEASSMLWGHPAELLPYPPNVTVTLRGSSRKIRTLVGEVIEAEAAPERVLQYEHGMTVMLRNEDIHIPGREDVRILEISPSMICGRAVARRQGISE